MTQTDSFDWYILIDAEPAGPVSAEALATLVLKRKLTAIDLVWCEGLANWMPVGAVLGASERPKPRAVTHSIHVEATERRDTAHRVKSLSKLYVETLTERHLAPVPQRASAAPSYIVEAHDGAGSFAGQYDDPRGYGRPSAEAPRAHYVEEPRQRPSETWQPELTELARLVEVSEASVDWSSEWGASKSGTALARPRYS